MLPWRKDFEFFQPVRLPLPFSARVMGLACEMWYWYQEFCTRAVSGRHDGGGGGEHEEWPPRRRRAGAGRFITVGSGGSPSGVGRRRIYHHRRSYSPWCTTLPRRAQRRRAHTAWVRGSAPPPPRHVCVTRQQAGLGTRGRRPHCPPQSPGTQPLFHLLVFVPHLCTGFEEFLPLSTSCARDMPVAAPPVSILEIPALTPLTFHNRRSVPTPSIPE